MHVITYQYDMDIWVCMHNFPMKKNLLKLCEVELFKEHIVVIFKVWDHKTWDWSPYSNLIFVLE